MTVHVGRARDGAVASFEARPDGTGYDVTVSDRARTTDVNRAVAHELAEIVKSQEPDIPFEPSDDRPTEMTPHLAGRFAELKVLAHEIDRARLDPSRAEDLPRAQKDLADLMDHIGLRDDPTAHIRLDLLREHDPLLARRLDPDSGGQLHEHRPVVGPDLSEHDFAAGKAAHLDHLANLLADQGHDLRTAESLALDGRMREENGRRVFDPIFEDNGKAAYNAARAAKATGPLFAATNAMGEHVNNPHLTPAERADAMLRTIHDLESSPRLPDSVKSLIDFDRMRQAAEQMAHGPNHIAGVLDHNTGDVVLHQDIPGHQAGDRIPLRDLLHTLDQANQTAADHGVNAEYAAVIHQPANGHSTVDVLSRPRPQHRHEAVGHAPRPEAPAAAHGGHTIDVGVGRSAFGVEMTPAADHQHGGLVIQTELPDQAVTAQARRDVGINDPAPLTGPGSVLVFGDMLNHGDVLGHGNGDIARVYINNVSAHIPDSAYHPIAEHLVAGLADHGRVEVQWDSKPENPNAPDAHPNDRGHIQGDKLAPAMVDAARTHGWSVEVTHEHFGEHGNPDYDYSIDAGTKNTIDSTKMAQFANPRPEHRTVITLHRTAPAHTAEPAAAHADTPGHTTDPGTSGKPPETPAQTPATQTPATRPNAPQAPSAHPDRPAPPSTPDSSGPSTTPGDAPTASTHPSTPTTRPPTTTAHPPAPAGHPPATGGHPPASPTTHPTPPPGGDHPAPTPSYTEHPGNHGWSPTVTKGAMPEAWGPKVQAAIVGPDLHPDDAARVVQHLTEHEYGRATAEVILSGRFDGAPGWQKLVNALGSHGDWRPMVTEVAFADSVPGARADNTAFGLGEKPGEPHFDIDVQVSAGGHEHGYQIKHHTMTDGDVAARSKQVFHKINNTFKKQLLNAPGELHKAVVLRIEEKAADFLANTRLDDISTLAQKRGFGAIIQLDDRTIVLPPGFPANPEG